MIEFIKKNKIISVFAIISILIVVSYAITYSMLDYYGIEGWYSLFNNISISYIAAVIFYVLQVYLPDCQSQKRAQAILKPAFVDLIEFLELTVVCCNKFVLCKEDGKIYIDWTDKDNKCLYFVPIKGDKNVHRPAVKKTKSDIKCLNVIFMEKIKCIKKMIEFKMCDQSIIDTLSKIEMLDFYKSTIETILTFESSFVCVSNFQESLKEFEILKDEFKQFCGVTDRYNIRDAEGIEIAANEAIANKGALQASTREEFYEIVGKTDIEIQLKSKIQDEETLKKIVDQVWSEILKKKLAK